MDFHGKSFVGKKITGEGKEVFHAVNPALGSRLEPGFLEATESEIGQALSLAEEAFAVYRQKSPEERARFLERIAGEIQDVGDGLLRRAAEETGLPEARLVSERGRTVGQFRMFAGLIREGSWVEARIDRPLPDRKPLPKPDLRRLLIPLGPVVVFGASNFPLAYSVAGGDTASAFAAGCPVVVKAHPAHPGTSELVARAILRAVEAAGMPNGVFSMLHGKRNETGLSLVRHRLTKAVAFTGSLKGGRALFDGGVSRPDPIPVYAEMGSINPVFFLPGALRERAESLAEGLHGSVTLGVGQFCTNPGLVLGLKDPSFERFLDKLKELTVRSAPGTMLHEGIRQGYEAGTQRLRGTQAVKLAARAAAPADQGRTEAPAMVFVTEAGNFLEKPELHDEVFGPSTLVVSSTSKSELEEIARRLQGHLTATIHASPEDLSEYRALISILETKVGRLVFNGFPTGVEVCPAMQHGGPYPATTDARTTSVGTAAISRFVRPICYQNWPQEALPVELRDKNERKIWRLVDGTLTREDVGG